MSADDKTEPEQQDDSPKTFSSTEEICGVVVRISITVVDEKEAPNVP